MSYEPLRNEIIRAVETYDERFQRQLEQYESQRAWQIMLAIRKAYTLLMRTGWAAKADFARWLFWDLPRGKGDLASARMPFPDVWNFLPQKLHEPWAGLPNFGSTPALTAVSGQASKYDVIILPVFDFEFRFQRPQQLAVQFARAGHRVFWISPSRTLGPDAPASFEVHRIRQNIWEVNLRSPKLDLYTGSMTAAGAEALSATLDEFWREAAIAESCVLLQFPFWRKLGLNLRRRWNSKVVYDCMDDWQHWTTEPLISAGNLEDERKLVRECDVLVVTAQEFCDRFAENPVAPVFAPNASDFDSFASAPDNSLLERFPRPIIGYYGAIADWFDAEAVAHIARSRPNYSVVLIGQVHGSDLSRLKGLPNVHLLGEKRYREIPLYLRNFDVCLIPFLNTRLMKAVDPVKMYEYFAQGKPVVAARMPELQRYDQLLYLADTPAEYLAGVDAALREDEEKKERRIEFAAANTWTQRFETIDTAIQATFPLVSLIVLTYNTAEYLAPFWDSVVRNTTYPNIEILFVDNNSSDGTRAELQRIAGDDPRVRLLLLDRNLGFAGGNNAGVSESKGEYLAILNPDTVLTRGWVERLLRPLRGDPKVGMTAPVSNFSGNETRVATKYVNVSEMEGFAESLARSRAGDTMDVPAIPLFCALVSRKLWDQAGGLDERFRIGMFEDDDFSVRLHELGYRTVTAEDCFIHHFGNGSFGKLPSAESLRIFAENRQAFEGKWGRPWRPHRTRPGVPPPGPEDRWNIAAFLRGAEAETPHSTARIRRLIPPATLAGVPFNPQPCGSASLIVECEGAARDTTVLWNGHALQTTYGGMHRLTALVPGELYSSPLKALIALSADDEAVSDPATFVVRDHAS